MNKLNAILLMTLSAASFSPAYAITAPNTFDLYIKTTQAQEGDYQFAVSSYTSPRGAIVLPLGSYFYSQTPRPVSLRIIEQYPGVELVLSSSTVSTNKYETTLQIKIDANNRPMSDIYSYTIEGNRGLEKDYITFNLKVDDTHFVINNGEPLNSLYAGENLPVEAYLTGCDVDGKESLSTTVFQNSESVDGVSVKFSPTTIPSINGLTTLTATALTSAPAGTYSGLLIAKPVGAPISNATCGVLFQDFLVDVL